MTIFESLGLKNRDQGLGFIIGELQRLRALAAQHHLPADFQATIAATPAGPAVGP